MKLPVSSKRRNKPSLLVRRIVGDSMLPSLRSGQLVLFVAGRRPRVGTIVMLRHDGIEKIKRIARIESGRVYVLGDNPAVSTDSRQFGWLGLETVRATLVLPRLPKR